MRILLSLAVSLALTAAAAAQDVKTPITDADTLKVDGVDVRLVDYDAPETFDPNCDAERNLGYQAVGYLNALMNRRAVRLEYLPGVDKYYRRLARLYVGQDKAGDLLIAAGLAVPYDGRTRRTHWATTLCNLPQPKASSDGFLE